jgi:hypothetical protein
MELGLIIFPSPLFTKSKKIWILCNLSPLYMFCFKKKDKKTVSETKIEFCF